MLIVHFAIVGGFLALLVWIAVSDLREFTIPNRASLAITALYPAHVIASPVPVDWQGGLIVGALLLAVGFVLFMWNIAGGGDAKFFASVGLWAGTSHILGSALAIGLIGGLISIYALARFRFTVPKSEPDVGLFLWFGAAIKVCKVPYGVAIAAGGVYTASQLLTG